MRDDLQKQAADSNAPASRILFLLEGMFEGRAYPAFVALLVLLGHIFAIEIFTGATIAITLAIGIFLFRSAKPLCAVLLMYLYQCSVKNSPAMPSFSDHYFTGGRGAVMLVSFALVLASLVYAAVRERWVCYRRILSMPMKGASVALTFAFLLNGVFGGEWRIEGFLFGAAQSAVYFLLFYFLLAALSSVGSEEFLDYLIYVCALCAAVLILQTLYLYTFGGVIEGGVAEKGQILYGWGIWTTAGMDMSVLVPILVLGAMRSTRPIRFYLLALACWLCAVLTLSRNALVFATLALAVSLFLACLFSKKTQTMRCAVGFTALIFAALAIALGEEILTLLKDFAERGFSDNGRFALWKYALELFRDAPMFGKGFFAIETDTFRAEHIFPQMLHNTPLQIAASCGIAGLLSYSYYRVCHTRLMISSGRSDAVLLLVSSSTLVLMSLFDNFLFHLQPMICYTLVSVAAAKLSPSENGI